MPTAIRDVSWHALSHGHHPARTGTVACWHFSRRSVTAPPTKTLPARRRETNRPQSFDLRESLDGGHAASDTFAQHDRNAEHVSAMAPLKAAAIDSKNVLKGTIAVQAVAPAIGATSSALRR